MKYLFIIAMKKEADDIINHYKLDKIDDNYYKKDNLACSAEGFAPSWLAKSW